MARPERFELPTAWFVARYSIQLSYGRAKPNIINGCWYGVKTTDSELSNARWGKPPDSSYPSLPIGALPSHPGTNLLRQRRERQRRIALYPLTNSPKYLCGEVTTRNQHENRLPKTASRVPQKMWGMISFYKGGNNSVIAIKVRTLGGNKPHPKSVIVSGFYQHGVLT